MDNVLINIVRWLLNANPSTATSALTPKIVVAHIPGAGSYYFNQDANTRQWLTSRLPGATVNQINACDNYMLSGCLTGAQLLVIGRQVC